MATLIIDKAGRVVLPKPVRDEMRLRAGDSLTIEKTEDQIVLRPLRGGTGLRKKQGIWVFNTGEPISTEQVNQAIHEVRSERETNFLGRSTRIRHRKKSK
jgi:AbrB family looped-hinge helix DNA binding protein